MGLCEVLKIRFECARVALWLDVGEAEKMLLTGRYDYLS